MSLNSKSVGTCLDCTTLNPHRVTLLNCVIYGDKRMTSRAKSDLKCFKVCKTKELLCLSINHNFYTDLEIQPDRPPKICFCENFLSLIHGFNATGGKSQIILVWFN